MTSHRPVSLMAIVLALITAGAVPAHVADRAQAPSRATAPAPAAAKFDSNRAWEHLRRQVAFGPRPAGSPALTQTRQYIVEQLKVAGLTAHPQTWVAKTPAGDISMTNLIATIPGRSRERIVIASHYDTKRASAFRFVGASDGASSTAVLLELARVFAAQRGALTIELLFLDGEEAVNWDWGTTGVDNTYGSRYYVDAARKAGTLTGIKALVLLDMVGDRDLVIRRDLKSTPWLVDLVWSTAARLGHGSVFANETTEVDDDHVAFVRAGIPSVDIIDLDYPQWHTAQDDLDHVSARSLQTVGDVVVAALPAIEKRAPQK
jgi:glutaminyl-peptide cyclotransferase